MGNTRQLSVFWGLYLMGRTQVCAEITWDSIFREPTAGHRAFVKYGRRNGQMKQLGSSYPCVPLLRLFSLSLLAALLQQTASSLTEGLISIWILPQQGQMCTCTHPYMQWLKVLLSRRDRSNMPHLGLLASILSMAFLKCSVDALASVYTGCSQLRAYGFGGLRPSYQL